MSVSLAVKSVIASVTVRQGVEPEGCSGRLCVQGVAAGLHVFQD